MFDIFKKYVAVQATLTSDEFERICTLSASKRIAKQEFILKEGEWAGTTHFVTKGLLRLFRIDQKGNAHILKFAHENRWINDRESYLTGNPASANIEAIEDSEILSWKKTDFDLLLNEIPAFKQLMKNLSAKNQIANQNRIYASISQSAEEKYHQFIEKNQTIVNRVPLYMVASYLGLSRETLSRIRRQALSK